jgi:hypothetical protein
MARFVTEDQTEKVERPLDFTRASRGSESAGTFIGKALDNAGDMLLRGANDLDRKFGEYVTEQAKDAAEKANIQHHGIDSGRLPPDVVKTYEKLTRLKAAADKGGISATSYATTRLAYLKQLNNEHPGYNDEIIKGLGGNPANEVIAERKAQLAAANAAANNKTKKDAEFVEWANRNAPGQWQQWQASKQEGGVGALRVMVADHRAKEEAQKLKTEQIKQKIDAGQYSRQEAETDLINAAEAEVNASINMVTGEFRALSLNIQEMMNSGQEITKEQEQAVNLHALQLKAKTMERVEKAILSNPAYATNAEAADKARQFALSRVNNFTKALIGKEANIALIEAASADRSVQGVKDVGNIKNPDMLTALWLQQKFGKDAAEEFMKEKGLTHTAIGKAYSADATLNLGDDTSPVQSFTETLDKLWAAKVEDVGAYKDVLNNGVKLLTGPGVPMATRERAARHFFDPKNIGYITKFDTKDQGDIFRAVLNPSMYKSVKEVADYHNKPEYVDNYKQLYLASFKDLVNLPLETLNTYQTTVGAGAIAIDPTTGLVKIDPARDENGNSYPVSMEAKAAVGVMNRALANLHQHWDAVREVEKREPLSKDARLIEIRTILENSGLKIGAEKIPSVLDRVIDYYNSPSRAKGAPPLEVRKFSEPPSRATGYQMDQR